jgi:hypothetical protein
LFVLQIIFFRLTETLGVDSGIFCNRNFGISNPYEVYNEVSVERKLEKFSKFQAKINYCVRSVSWNLGWAIFSKFRAKMNCCILYSINHNFFYKVRPGLKKCFEVTKFWMPQFNFFVYLLWNSPEVKKWNHCSVLYKILH